MSSHHNNLTSPNANSGACTDVRWTSAPTGSTLEDACKSTGGTFLTACSVNPTAGVCTMAANTKDKCTAVSGTWVAAKAGWCSNAFYSDAASCTANKYTWTDGWCKTADAQAACTGGTGDGAKTWRANGTQASCQVAGAAWTFSKCTRRGLLQQGDLQRRRSTRTRGTAPTRARPGTAIRSKAACDSRRRPVRLRDRRHPLRVTPAAGGTATTRTAARSSRRSAWTATARRRAACRTRTAPAATASRRPRAPASPPAATWTETGQRPAAHGRPVPQHRHLPEPPGTATSSSTARTPSSAGKWSEIATGKYDGSSTGKYQSAFMTSARPTTRATAAPAATRSTRASSSARSPSAKSATTATTSRTSSTSRTRRAPARRSRWRKRTRWRPCVMCHMPERQHLFRINTDAAYSTFPMPAAMTANTAANTAADGSLHERGLGRPRRRLRPVPRRRHGERQDDRHHRRGLGRPHGGERHRVSPSARGSTSPARARSTTTSRERLVRPPHLRQGDRGQRRHARRHRDQRRHERRGHAEPDHERRELPDQGDPRGPREGDAQRQPGGEIHGGAGRQRADGRRRRLRHPSAAAASRTAAPSTGTGATAPPHGSGITATHTYAAPGNYTITLTVEDEETGTGHLLADLRRQGDPGRARP